MKFRGNGILQKAEEKALVDLIIYYKSFFNQIYLCVLFDPINRNRERYDGFKYITTVLRKDLRLFNDRKPGDFDLLIIPFISDKLIFEDTAVIEIKIVRPTLKKLKSPNSSGLDQITGLMLEGVPFIGLVHIIIPEPLEDFQVIKMENDEGYPEDFIIDELTFKPVSLQMHRLQNLNLPNYVGYNSFAYSFEEDYIGCSSSVNDINYAQRNPNTSAFFLTKLRLFYKNNSDRFKEQLNLYS